MKILFLAPYPFDEAPSQRFRFEQYFQALKDNKIEFQFYSFYSGSLWKGILAGRSFLWKLPRLVASFWLRFIAVIGCPNYDWIFIHREAAPAGPPCLEWIIARIFRKKIIYDFDDAIWLTDDVERAEIVNKIKWQNKTRLLCRWSYKVSCGNEYLRQFALAYNKNSVKNPTTVNTDQYHSIIHKHHPGKIVVGWTGSHTTLKYLYNITDVLEKIEGNTDITIAVICNERPAWKIKNYRFILWNRENEIDDLDSFDIGLMPLPDDPWTRGKCGFKAIQYLSLGIPALVSPLEVNKEIVDHGLNGYYCSSSGDWLRYISDLAGDPEKRNKFGRNGREKIIKNYSTASNLRTFLGLFE